MQGLPPSFEEDQVPLMGQTHPGNNDYQRNHRQKHGQVLCAESVFGPVVDRGECRTDPAASFGLEFKGALFHDLSREQKLVQKRTVLEIAVQSLD